MKHDRRGSIGKRLLAYFLPLMCGGLFIVFAALETRNYQTQMDALRASLDQFVVTQAAALAQPVWQYDTATLELLVQVMSSNPDVHDISVTDKSGFVFAEVTVDTHCAEDDLMRVQYSIVYMDSVVTQEVGHLNVSFHTTRIWETITQRVIVDAVVLVALCGLLVAVTLSITGRIISNPIRKLHDSINTTRLDVQPETVEWNYDDELGEVVRAYNDMRTHQHLTESRLRDFAQSTSDWFWEMDENLRFSYFSERNKEITGFDSSEYVGKTRREIAAGQISDKKWDEHLDDLDDRRAFRDFRYELACANGEVLTISISGTPRFDDDNNFCGYRGTGSDVTDHAKADKALQETTMKLQEDETRLRQAAKLTQVGYWLWDEVEDRAISCSEECARIHGVTVEEFIERMSSTEKDVAWTHPDDRELYLANSREITENHVPVEMEYRLITPQGEVRYVRDIAEPEFDENGVLVRSIGSVQDITEQKMGEMALLEAKEESERANAAKSDFLAHMSHELRTPLNSIIGFSQMMTEEIFGKLGSDKYLGYVTDIQASGRHLLQFINDILDISKIEVGELKLDDADIDLNELLDSAIRIVRGRPDAATIKVEFEPSENTPRIRADERLIRQIVLNLLANAMKYNEEDGSVTMSTLLDETNAIQIIVSDTGVGIAPEDIPKVLEPFGQVRTNSKLAHEGTGLGLSLSKQLAELHGGTLELESEVGAGTRVTITIPPERVLHR